MSFKDCQGCLSSSCVFHMDTHKHTYLHTHIHNNLLRWSHSRNSMAGKHPLDAILKRKAHNQRSRERSALRGDLSWKMPQKSSFDFINPEVTNMCTPQLPSPGWKPVQLVQEVSPEKELKEVTAQQWVPRLGKVRFNLATIITIPKLKVHPSTMLFHNVILVILLNTQAFEPTVLFNPHNYPAMTILLTPFSRRVNWSSECLNILLYVSQVERGKT